jgi:hypothetical protein
MIDWNSIVRIGHFSAVELMSLAGYRAMLNIGALSALLPLGLKQSEQFNDP